MLTDLLLLICYVTVIICSKKDRRVTPAIIALWSALSFSIAEMGLYAIPSFPIYWGMAGITLIVLVSRGAVIVSWGMGAMFMLQAIMTFDALVNSASTTLHTNYSILSLLVNIVILFLTFLHGRGLESAINSISINRVSSHDSKGD